VKGRWRTPDEEALNALSHYSSNLKETANLEQECTGKTSENKMTIGRIPHVTGRHKLLNEYLDDLLRRFQTLKTMGCIKISNETGAYLGEEYAIFFLHAPMECLLKSE
jgi:hypothetical protein